LGRQTAGVDDGIARIDRGLGANHHLRQSLVFLNMPLLQQSEAYIGGVARRE